MTMIEIVAADYMFTVSPGEIVALEYRDQYLDLIFPKYRQPLSGVSLEQYEHFMKALRAHYDAELIEIDLINGHIAFSAFCMTALKRGKNSVVVLGADGDRIVEIHGARMDEDRIAGTQKIYQILKDQLDAFFEEIEEYKV